MSGASIQQWCRERLPIPLVVAVLYLVAIWVGTKMMQSRKAFDLRGKGPVLDSVLLWLCFSKRHSFYLPDRLIDPTNSAPIKSSCLMIINDRSIGIVEFLAGHLFGGWYFSSGPLPFLLECSYALPRYRLQVIMDYSRR